MIVFTKANKNFNYITALAIFSFIIYLSSSHWKVLLDNADFRVWRKQIMLFSGVIAWVLMTVCMISALRPLWFDKFIGGIDKGYKLHKWSGIIAMVILAFHWMMHEIPRWLSAWDILPMRKKIASAGSTDSSLWIELAKPTGEWAFYACLIVVILSLFKRFPYTAFSKLHKIFPIIYLFGAYHTLAIIPAQWWQTPAAYIITIITAAGIYAACISLMQRIGQSLKTKTQIIFVQKNHSDIIDIILKPSDRDNIEHQAGQFMFVDFKINQEGPHPFTIASSNKKTLRFMIKPLGDFTKLLGDKLAPGQNIWVEGPYGQFNFSSEKSHQIWIAGGIGITPFLSRLEQLSKKTNQEQNVNLWYCTRKLMDNLHPENLDVLCEQAGVRLHRIVSEKGQRLTTESILLHAPEISDCSVWFCGPSEFANFLKNDLLSKGLNKEHFHSESFEMR